MNMIVRSNEVLPQARRSRPQNVLDIWRPEMSRGQVLGPGIATLLDLTAAFAVAMEKGPVGVLEPSAMGCLPPEFFGW
jgi:hypothetical protein